jgi:hypothetical protein
MYVFSNEWARDSDYFIDKEERYNLLGGKKRFTNVHSRSLNIWLPPGAGGRALP